MFFAKKKSGHELAGWSWGQVPGIRTAGVRRGAWACYRAASYPGDAICGRRVSRSSSRREAGCGSVEWYPRGNRELAKKPLGFLCTKRKEFFLSFFGKGLPRKLRPTCLPSLTSSLRPSSCNSLDPFLKKDWYDIKAPSMFSVKQVGKTLVTRSAGTKIASDGLKGRVFECSLADLNQVRVLCFLLREVPPPRESPQPRSTGAIQRRQTRG